MTFQPRISTNNHEFKYCLERTRPRQRELTCNPLATDAAVSEGESITQIFADG